MTNTHPLLSTAGGAERKILISLLAVASAILAFAKIASEVLEGDTMALDRHLLTLLRDPANPALPIGPSWLNGAMLDITAFGGVTGLTLMTIVVSGYLLITRNQRAVCFLLGAAISGATLGTLLKTLFHRSRPEVVAHLVQVNTASFPSGHAVNSAVIYLTLGALLARTQRDWRVRTYVLGVAIAMTVSIGCSRVYLGVHWPSDVVAGWIIGAAWATFCSLVAGELQRRAMIEPAQGPAVPAADH